MSEKCCDLNETVHAFYNQLKYFIFNRVKDQALAEDLVQEVMLRLITAHSKGTSIHNLKAWLYQITRNVIADYYKKNSTEPTLSLDGELDFISDSEVSILLSDYIVPMISLLPDQYAIPLKLHDIEKKSQKEISTQLQIGLSATKMRIQRARTKLRELFVECCEIEYNKNGTIISCTIKDSCTPLKNIQENLHSKTL